MSTQANHTHNATYWVRVALVLAVSGLLALVSGGILLGTGGPVSADPPSDPPGSNGEFVVTAQVDTFNPAMDPHLPCDIRVWFYGYDEGETISSVSFTPQAPTAGADSNNVAYTVTATGFTTGTMGPQDADNHRLNLVRDYSLAWTGRAHPQQGYNVKLEVVTTQTGEKSKVFWVQCAAPEPTPTPTPTETPTVTPTETPTETPTGTPTGTPTETVQPTVPPVTSGPVEPNVTVEGSETTQPTPTVEGSEVTEPSETTAPDETTAPSPTVKGQQAVQPDESETPEVTGQPPVAVDAGVTGRTTAQAWGAGLVALGLVLLLGSGGVLVGARRLETS